jgi:hypothetical protein
MHAGRHRSGPAIGCRVPRPTYEAGSLTRSVSRRPTRIKTWAAPEAAPLVPVRAADEATSSPKYTLAASLPSALRNLSRRPYRHMALQVEDIQHKAQLARERMEGLRSALLKRKDLLRSVVAEKGLKFQAKRAQLQVGGRAVWG